MTAEEYETLQAHLKRLPERKMSPYFNRAQRDAYKLAVNACKSALHQYGPSYPDQFTGLPITRAEFDGMVKSLDGVEANTRHKKLTKDERIAYLAAITGCREVLCLSIWK